MNLFNPPKAEYSEYDNVLYTLTWRICLVTCMLFAALVLIDIADKLVNLSAYILAFVMSGSSVLYMWKAKRYKPVLYFLSFAGSAILYHSLYRLHQVVHFSDFVWMCVIILIGYLGLGKKTGHVILVLNIVGMSIYAFVFQNANLESIPEQRTIDMVNLTMELALATFSIAYIANNFEALYRSAGEKLNTLNQELEKQITTVNAQNDEKTVLIKEIHHRVKNNLQIIISLLRLQKYELKTEEAQQQFDEAISRIMTMALIHQKLYQQTDLKQINIAEYVDTLALEIKSVTYLDKEVAVKVKAEEMELGLNTIVPLGLIINELISNSFKHAFSNLESGVINIELHPTDNNQFTLDYEDNGSWKPQDEEQFSFGLELIDTFTSQLDGQLKREGSNYRFVLANLDV